MTPFHIHINWLSSVSIGKLANSTFGLHEIQGLAVAGIHGADVGTPSAADVVAITAGLVSALHMPNGGIFVTGIKSIILALGVPSVTLFVGSTLSVEGATPKPHCMVAPLHTQLGIIYTH